MITTIKLRVRANILFVLRLKTFRDCEILTGLNRKMLPIFDQLY